MSDDGPNYSRNIVQRRQLVPVAVTLAFISTTLVVIDRGLGVVQSDPQELPSWASLVVVLAGLAIGVVAAALAGFATNRVHRSMWPEHPNEV
jgi:uncharacterized membrane protein